MTETHIELDYGLTPEELELHHIVAETMVRGWVFWGPAATGAAILLGAGWGAVLLLLPLSLWVTPAALLTVVVVAVGLVSTIARYRGHPYRGSSVQIFAPGVRASASAEGVRHRSRFVRTRLKWRELKLLIVSESHLVAATSWLTLVVPRRAIRPADFERMARWAGASASDGAIVRGAHLAPGLGLQPTVPEQAGSDV